MSIRGIFLLVGFALSAYAVLAQPSGEGDWADDLNRHLDRWMHQYHLPGVVVIRLQDGMITSQIARGWADEQRQVPLTLDHVFPLGALTQSLTAYGILQLAHAGTVKLDVPVNTYLDRWELPATPFNPGDVTVRGLLSHTAGIKPWPAQLKAEHTSGTLEQITGRGGYPPVRIKYPPGMGFRYAEPGYLLLQFLLEEVTDSSYAHFVNDRVLRSISIGRAKFGAPEQQDTMIVTGHSWFGRAQAPGDAVGSQAGSGGYMRPLDYARFWSHLVAASDSTTTVIRQNMLQPQVSRKDLLSGGDVSYGLGVFLQRAADSIQFVYTQSEDRSFCPGAFFLEASSGDGILVFTNGQGGKAFIHRIVSFWAQKHGLPLPAPVLRAFYYQLGLWVLLVLVALVCIYLMWWLYTTRHLRRFRLTTYAQGLYMFTLGLLSVLIARIGLPAVLQAIPHFFIPVVLVMSAYLLLLLLWICTPVDARSRKPV